MNYTLWHEFPKRPKVISYKSSWYDSGGLSKHCSKPWDWQLINREGTLGTEMLQIKQHILKEDAKNRKANLLFPKCTAPLVLLNMPCSQSQHNRWVSALKSNMKEACVSLACFLNSHSAEWFEVIEKRKWPGPKKPSRDSPAPSGHLMGIYAPNANATKLQQHW